MLAVVAMTCFRDLGFPLAGTLLRRGHPPQPAGQPNGYQMGAQCLCFRRAPGCRLFPGRSGGRTCRSGPRELRPL